MRIAVFGAGGVGGYFGALLARAGHELTIVARGAHLAAVQRAGLAVKSALGDFHVQPARAIAPGEAAACELVLVAVKNYDLEAALPAIAAVAGDGAAVLSLLNGIDAPELLARVVAAERVLVGQCSVGAWVSAPGEVTHIGSRRGIALGEWRRPVGDRTRAVAEVLEQAGIQIELVEDVVAAAWKKLIWTAAYSGVAALARAGAGPVRSSAALRALVEQGLREGEEVARALGVALPSDIVAGSLATLDGLAPDARPSLLRDLERGKKLETEALSGAIVRAAARAGVAAPLHEVVHKVLLFAHQQASGQV